MGLPSPEELESYQAEGFLEQAEREELEQWRPRLDVLRGTEKLIVGRRLLQLMWPDELTYLSKVCWITTKEGKKVPLRPNYAQRRFYEDVILRCRREGRPIRGVILKARQLGFSTFIQALQYVWCELNAFRNCMTLSYDEGSTKYLFQEKTKFIHSNHWFPLPTKNDTGGLIKFAEPHHSAFYTYTAGSEHAGRSFTIHCVHLSELPMWKDAVPVLLGLKQSVPMTLESCQLIESTARGRIGPFYETWDKAEKGENDYVPFFAPWYWDPDYTLPFISPKQKTEFMRRMSTRDGRYMERYTLSAEQMHWRSWKIRNDLDGSERRFRQEFPATALEAFLTTGAPVFDPEKIRELELQTSPPRFTGEIMLERD